MLTKSDCLLALIFASMLLFGASTVYNVVKRAALVQISKGLSPMHRFQTSIDGRHYCWEDEN